MTLADRVESVQVPGGAFSLALWAPAAGNGPGLLLLPEIYGLSDYIEAVAQDLAGLGYVVGVPDLFWRLKPGHRAAHDDAGLAESSALNAQFSEAQGAVDSVAALEHLGQQPEVTGGLGVIGFCLGGSVAFLVAAEVEPGTLEAVVSFYGATVPDNLAALDYITAPVQLQFGGSDPYIPRESVALVESGLTGLTGFEMHVEEEAGHAFHNRFNPRFYEPGAAGRAWPRTVDFLHRHLPASAGQPPAAPGA